jgi:hypothetical protein
MTTGETGHERRGINDGIEKAYMEAGGLAAAIRTHLGAYKKGVLSDVFELFHFNFGILFNLTCDRQEMDDEKEVVEAVDRWLESPPPGDKELVARCNEGRKLFREYSRALNRKGLLNLPAS